MTKAQYRAFNRLRKKQTNASDVRVVESSQSCAVIYVAFPGLYLTYSNDGKLLLTETVKEREAGKGQLLIPGMAPVLVGEMGDGFQHD